MSIMAAHGSQVKNNDLRLSENSLEITLLGQDRSRSGGESPFRKATKPIWVAAPTLAQTYTLTVWSD